MSDIFDLSIVELRAIILDVSQSHDSRKDALDELCARYLSSGSDAACDHFGIERGDYE